VPVTVDTPEAARRIREDLKQAETKKEAEALVAIIDAWHSKGTGRETTLTGEQVRSDGQTISRSRDGQIVREITDAKTLQTLREEARMDASATGSQDIDVLVNGSNSMEFTESVAGAAKTMIQRLELNQSESTALTAIHEQVESTWRAGNRKRNNHP
jgi:predicted class III extradiol MEMO1 family dioxygenase